MKDDYQISNWGEGYFQINHHGNIEVKVKPETLGVELCTLVRMAHEVGIKLPLLIRFSDILQDRVIRIYRAFSQAIERQGYQGTYQLVYPIKVNQENSVVRSLLETPAHSIGLEAGSKAELMAVIGALKQRSATIICNGYKDHAYIRIALIAQQMGHRVFIVIEKLSELAILLQESTSMNLRPNIGVRIRLVTKGAGKWENTAGSKSKFGLNAEQILKMIEQLKQAQFIDCLTLMHCHLGSQIANVRDIEQCMKEVSCYYTELRKLNIPIHTIDVGGGLGVDYEGNHTESDCSMNYTLEEYAVAILSSIQIECQKSHMPEPHIISESGRALTAHHAVLITEITDIETVHSLHESPLALIDSSVFLHSMQNIYQSLQTTFSKEQFLLASDVLAKAHESFKLGHLSLVEKAKVEQLFTSICHLSKKQMVDIYAEDEIHDQTTAKIYCNLSFFQSIPDAWALEQIFPILPISQLNNPATLTGILQDLSCDSDGTIKRYSGKYCTTPSLPLPAYHPETPYALAFFMVGAYQETLGNLHNLFGETPSLDVKMMDNGDFHITNLVTGNTIEEVLTEVHYDKEQLMLSYEEQLVNHCPSIELTHLYLQELRNTFSHQTYLENNQFLFPVHSPETYIVHSLEEVV